MAEGTDPTERQCSRRIGPSVMSCLAFGTDREVLIDHNLSSGSRESGMHGPVGYSTRRSGAAMGIYDREYYRGETGGPSLV